MKKMIVALLVLIGVFGLTACGNSDDSGKTKITYYQFSAPADGKALQKMISEFEKQNPKIKVDVQTIAYDDYFTKLQTQIAGGDAPDAFELNYETFVQYAEKGVLADLNGFIKADKTFDPKQLNQEAYNAFNYKGKQYGMVESFSNVVTIYNKDMFDKAGLKYPTADWTWEDELNAAKKLTNKDKRIWGTSQPVTMNEFFKVAAQNGGSVFNKDMTAVTMNSKQNLEALQHLTDEVTKYKVSPSPSDMSGQLPEDLFMNGQIGMLHTGIWLFDKFQAAPFKWDIAVEAGNTSKATHFFSNGIGVSKDSKHKEAAYKLAAFMSADKEAAKTRIESNWELPATENKEVLKPYLEMTPPDNRQVVFDSLQYMVLPPVVADWNKISDYTNAQFEKVLNKEQSAEEALDNCQKEITKIMNF
ncbi:sugar ABC transporter substrate-binding protein [Listeria booriae]|uniref:sugar ABC transporter substrate-binding protein n=1 Tax=Listeria booriae TaxID=1552123 RepID=UPI00162741FF|nr:sugar ABC transporter substrate-binding protein [Listeria booriae]MBC1984232.1 sugar ABC transporter substrate-binding protein [Listeria booriae]